MAIDISLLSSTAPSAQAPGAAVIGHVQLRDLIICPRAQGVVNYVHDQAIVEHDIRSHRAPRKIACLSFTPNTLASLPVSDSDYTLIAAGGQEAELHLSLHSASSTTGTHPHTLWQFDSTLSGSINNSVLLSSLTLGTSNQSSAEPRVGISNNDCSVKFYDVPLRGRNPPKSLKDCGLLRLNVPVNHSSISPDGQTLLSVGDSPKVYLHNISGSSRLSFTPIHALTLPAPDSYPLSHSSSLAASFSTAFSANGSKFAVASQEGLVAVWDVRSTRPLKVFQTDKSRATIGGSPNSSATGWLSDDPFDWTRGTSKAPGWSVRSVKFSPATSGMGKELMIFTEHTSRLHVVDACTFETEEIINVPPAKSRTRSRQVRHTSRTSPLSPPRPSRRSQSTMAPPPPFVTVTSPVPAPVQIPTPTLTPPPELRRGRGADTPSFEAAERDYVVIPPMGHPATEQVQTILEHHGLRARTRHTTARPVRVPFSALRYATSRDDHMDVDADGDDHDCLSSAPHSRSGSRSRSSSPSPSTNAPVQPSPAPPQASGSRQASTPPAVLYSHDGYQNWTITEVDEHEVIEDNSAPSRGARFADTFDRHGDYVGAFEDDDYADDDDEEAEDGVLPNDHMGADANAELDLAGTCFDPTGTRIYVASLRGIAEWRIRGAEKRWWSSGGWV
ncbi:hypothetical protein HGRIS_002850 [Hohenbuehelia grisea]|uniref:DUF2415 domain-containing protein n=1 Tax=Hohenbuehelia grisea TaxID=104357 RepID=A0ABR3JLR5_9AGAR